MAIKKIFLAVLCIFLAHQPASAANYVQIPYPTGVTIHLDVDSIDIRDDHVRAWVKLVPGADSIEGLRRATYPELAYFTQLNAFQKASKTYQILEFEYYGEDDALLGEEEFAYEQDFFQGIPDTSYMSAVYDEVMRRAQSPPAS